MSEYAYEAGSNVLAAAGKIRAFGDRLLVKAILKNSHYKGPLTLVTYHSVEALAFEVVSVGKGVERRLVELGEDPINIGDRLDVRSVAADRVDGADSTGLYWLVRVEDVAARHDRVASDDPALLAAIADVTEAQERLQTMPRGNGQIELAAG